MSNEAKSFQLWRSVKRFFFFFGQNWCHVCIPYYIPSPQRPCPTQSNTQDLGMGRALLSLSLETWVVTGPLCESDNSSRIWKGQQTRIWLLLTKTWADGLPSRVQSEGDVVFWGYLYFQDEFEQNMHQGLLWTICSPSRGGSQPGAVLTSSQEDYADVL